MYSISIYLLFTITVVHGFESVPLTPPLVAVRTTSTLRTTALFSVPPKRVARRDLKKRTTKRNRMGESRKVSDTSQPNNPKSNVQIETRPLVRSKSIEAGEDYWIDEKEFLKYSQRQEAIKNRKASEGEISKEKLQQEVVAPYKQNWIGLLSVGIIVLAVIAKEFPDLLNSPIIPIPDL
mmetsp:Transcript_69/g.127  ORF Transcript_69/g.127 Transcript_69/m.127 type:complete len:179 (-) Transcript_69:179-715(-)